MQEAATQPTTGTLSVPISAAPASSYNHLRAEPSSTPPPTSHSVSSSGRSGRTDSSSSSSSRSASISSDSESSESSYDSARSAVDSLRSSSIDPESRTAAVASNALSRAKFGREIHPGRLRVLRIKLLCILVALVVSSVTSLRFLESIGMFKSETLPATTVKESFFVYTAFVSNESRKVLDHVDQQYQRNLAEVNRNCADLLATASHRQNHTAITTSEWVSSFCPSLIDRVWERVEIPPDCPARVPRFPAWDDQKITPNECILCWRNRNDTAAFLIASGKPENYSSDYRFQQGIGRIACFGLQEQLLASITAVLGKVKLEETPGSRQNALKKRMDYDKEYIKKHMDFFKDMKLTRQNLLKDLEVQFDALKIAYGKLEGLNVDMKLKFDAQLQSLEDLKVNLKKFKVSTDFLRNPLSFLPDVVPDVPSLPDVNMPNVPNMPALRVQFGMPDVSIPSGFEDYAPPDVEGHVFSEGEIISRYLQRQADVASRSRSVPKSSMKAPKFFSIMSSMFEWIQGSLSLLVFSDLLFRFASCARYIAAILRVRKRNLLSASTKCRAIGSMICSSLPAIFIIGFIVFLLSQIVIAASKSAIVSDLTEEVEIQCHNRIVVASDKKRAAYSETLSSVRVQCDMDLNTINENIVKFNDVLTKAVSETREYEFQNYVSDARYAPETKCVPINISVPSREPPRLASTVNLTNPTSMEAHAFEIPSCQHAEEVQGLRREMRQFAVNMRRQVFSRIMAAVLLTIAGWLVIGAVRQWFWLELTEGYESDRPFTDDDVLMKAKSMRYSAIIQLVLTIPLCAIVALIGARKLEPIFLFGGAA